jgi:hypothetical protein
MADFPTNVFLRPPLLEGRDVVDGGLNAAMRRLGHLRDEVEAIESALGTGLKGSASSLVERLGKRLSATGIPRGQLYCVDFQHGIWSPEILYVQLFQASLSSGASTTRTWTFGTPYKSGRLPTHFVGIARQVAGTTNAASYMGVVGFDSSTLTTTAINLKVNHAGRTHDATTITLPLEILAIAFGGEPA